MSAKSFVAITSEGGMLPVDFLQELVSPRTAVEGLTPASYHLAEGERISEQVNRSWNRLKGCWANFRKATADKKPGDPTTSETRERWLQPLFQELGFGQKLPSAKPIEVEGRSYPVSHGWESVPMHLVGSHVDIDRRTPGAIGAAKASPHSLVQQTLNASDAHTWGIVSNGLVLRLLRDNITLTRMAYLEWDLAAIFDGDLYSEFFLLWLLCHQSRFEGERPDQCWLEKWKKEAADKSFRALEDLRPGVEKAISSLGEGLMSHPANKELLTKLQTGALDRQEFYRQILRVVYRMIFLFAAEDRGLLHPPLPENDSDGEAAALKARQRYQDFYSLSRLRQRSMYRTGTPHPDLWVSFQLVTQKLGSDAGSLELALPPLGSFLWQSDRSTPDLNGCLISNRHFLRAVQSLAFVKSDGVRRSVDYRNLGAEEIGAVYEGLLELHPKVNADLGTFELDTAAGNERKTSGSYYTPDSLVQCLLDTALDPVIDQAVAGKSGENAADAILRLKVCDPAVGSGHFLIAAAHRMARRVAAARTGEEEPSPEASRAALRDVIGRCLYGVDINPMSAELCRVSLWLEALEPGKPLSFLDHHIRVGNSLLGTTPELVAAGIPDDAFSPIEGDEKAACSALKKRNARERRGHGELFAQEDLRVMDKLRTAAGAVEDLPDDSTEAIRKKEEAFRQARESYDYLARRTLFDAWCAAFVIKKVTPSGSSELIGITTRLLNTLADGGSVPDDVRGEIQRLAKQYQFFHFPLELPEVFANGGFDVVLGNPPWEHIELKEKEWFTAHGREDIANAPNTAARARLITQLQTDDAALFQKFTNELRQVDGTRHFLADSGHYPFCGRGRVNLYAVFAEAMTSNLNASGRAGAVLPTGIATDDTTKFFFQSVIEKNSLRSLFDFENRSAIFPGVHRSYKFCLFTSGSPKKSSGDVSPLDFAFFCQGVEDLSNLDKRFTLSADDIALVNPNTRTCPIFRTRRDSELTISIYKKVPVFIRESRGGEPEQNLWGANFKQGLFNMSTDSHLFRTREQLETDGWTIRANQFRKGEAEHLPLYEAKMTHQFDHRAADVVISSTAQVRQGQPERFDAADYADPNRLPLPRYWVSKGSVTDIVALQSSFLGFSDVTSPTNERSMLCTTIPFSGVGHTFPLVFTNQDRAMESLLGANLNSFCFDYLGRQKLGGLHFTYFILKQLPILPPETYEAFCAWAVKSAQLLKDWMLPRVTELTYTAWDLESFAKDCDWDGPPFRWDEDRRFLLRCELDAAFFHLYGLNREDAAYILDTFPIVKRKDEEKYGTYRTKDTILEIYDELQAAMDSKQSYQTRLDPPPGPPIDKDGKFVRYEDIATNPPPHIHLPRNAKPANNEWQLTDLAREFPHLPFKLRSKAADGAVVNVQPVKPNTVNSGDHVVVAHPELRRGQNKLVAVTGRVVSIANRQDAASNRAFVHLAIQDTDGIAELRLPSEEWNQCESIGIIGNS